MNGPVLPSLVAKAVAAAWMQTPVEYACKHQGKVCKPNRVGNDMAIAFGLIANKHNNPSMLEGAEILWPLVTPPNQQPAKFGVADAAAFWSTLWSGPELAEIDQEAEIRKEFLKECRRVRDEIREQTAQAAAV